MWMTNDSNHSWQKGHFEHCRFGLIEHFSWFFEWFARVLRRGLSDFDFICGFGLMLVIKFAFFNCNMQFGAKQVYYMV